MKIEQKFIADDGTVFVTKEGCLNYEEEKAEERKKQEKLLKERAARRQEISDSLAHCKKLLDKYIEDYGMDIPTFESHLYPCTPQSFSSLFEKLFGTGV